MSYRKWFKGTEAECGLCAVRSTGVHFCLAQRGDGYGCTRPQGHRGKHVSCSLDQHRHATWPQGKAR